MKKIINPVPAGGGPVSWDTIQSVLNAEVWNALEATLQYVSNPSASGNVGVIISGCVVTGTTGNYSCTSGYVYMNGTFMYFPGFSSIALPQYIIPATLVNIPKTFYNGSSLNLITQQDATYQGTVPGSGQYISLTTTGNLGGLGGFRIENAASVQPAWVPITLNAAWSNNLGTFKYRIDRQGKVNLSGQVKTTTYSTPIIASTPAALASMASVINGVSLPIDPGIAGTTAYTQPYLQIGATTMSIGVNSGSLVNGSIAIINGVSFWPDENS